MKVLVWAVLGGLAVIGCLAGVAVYVGDTSVKEVDDGKEALYREICEAVGATRKFDVSGRRDIFRDYGLSNTQMNELEKYKEYVFSDDILCPIRLKTSLNAHG